jgi:hypothetical protein
MRVESIYEAAVQETERQHRWERTLDWGIGRFIKFAFPLVIEWERRKPPENRSVMRSLESRG